MEHRFKAGQKVRILDVESLGDMSAWAGRELTLKKHHDAGWSMEERDCHYRFRESEMELVSDGPVRTVTRQEITPGTYDGVVVSYEHDHRLTVHFMVERPSPGRLTRAAAVLTALAGALRDGE